MHTRDQASGIHDHRFDIWSIPTITFALLVTAGAVFAQNTGKPPTVSAVSQPAQLMIKELPQMPGKTVEVYLIERGPQQGNDPHTHPTAAVFGYVLEGEYEWQLRGDPVKRLKAGEMFYEAPGDIHQISYNPSKTQPVKLLVFFVKDKDAPRTVPAKP